MPRLISVFVLLATVLLLGVLFYRVMSSFFVPLFLALVLVVIFNPLYRWVLDQCNNRRRIAAGLTTVLVMLIVLVPAVCIVVQAAVEGLTVLPHADVASVDQQLSKLRGRFGLEIPRAENLHKIESTLRILVDQPLTRINSEDQRRIVINLLERVDELESQLSATGTSTHPDLQPLRDNLLQLSQSTPGMIEYDETLQAAVDEFEKFKLDLLGGPYWAWLKDLANPTEPELRTVSRQFSGWFQGWLLSATGATTAFAIKVVIGFIIMVIAIYFFFADGPSMIRTVMHSIPLKQSHQQELVSEFDRVSRAVVVATLLSAVIQGLLAGIGFWFAGLEAVFLLMLLTTMFAMIPFFGAVAVWLPTCLWLFFADERMFAAVTLAVYCTLIVSLSDNVVKPLILQGKSRLHPLLALLSILGGVQALGPLGILIGPMVVVFLQTLLRILHRELTTLPGLASSSSDP
jgi:predicted PurR-regulated permease PerM